MQPSASLSEAYPTGLDSHLDRPVLIDPRARMVAHQRVHKFVDSQALGEFANPPKDQISPDGELLPSLKRSFRLGYTDRRKVNLG